MKKVFLSAITVVIGSAMLLSGCGDAKNDDAKVSNDSKASNGKQQELKLMIWDKEEQIKGALDLFKEKHPEIKLDISFTDNKQYDNILNTKLASGSGPDVFEVGAQIRNLAAANFTLDLSDEPFISKYQESGLSSFSYKGKYYGVPWMSWVEGIFYNKTAFEKAGITQVPTTWDEFLQDHAKLKQSGIKPQTMGAKSWEPMMKQSLDLVNAGFFSAPANKDWNAKFSDKEANMSGTFDKYLEKWSEIVKQGYLTPDMLGMDPDQALDEFATGKAAMWESGNWSVNTIKQKNPDLDFGFFPIPAIEGKPWLMGGPGAAWAINKNSKAIDAAKTFLEFWSTPEAQLAAQKTYGGGIFLKDVTAPLDPAMDGAKEALAEGRIFAPWNEWFGAQAIILEYGKGMQNYLAGGGSLSDVLKNADKKRNEMFETAPK
ncbi:sugar ABC transporter substrate-binding protein [Paenibacillus sp. KQZ6P-2]|uniref:Sugar ABC transporter substrate-binding protein n=1 Tax=Paenibacillus mangrovi TaxID=2931978 RepID=A0A9X1WV31_9BACL|nr:sugar ABC transporter substrate-binding protein [Paenibacillus mangrovi]MCJ8014113.1 sugar ABC transporter substrate-binding protein [Paenibacillus mangrovi]